MMPLLRSLAETVSNCSANLNSRLRSTAPTSIAYADVHVASRTHHADSGQSLAGRSKTPTLERGRLLFPTISCHACKAWRVWLTTSCRLPVCLAWLAWPHGYHGMVRGNVSRRASRGCRPAKVLSEWGRRDRLRRVRFCHGGVRVAIRSVTGSYK